MDIRWIRGFLWRKGKIEIEKSANLSRGINIMTIWTDIQKNDGTAV